MPPSFTRYKAFLKNKKRSGTSRSASFSVRFLKKNKFSYILLTDQISFFWLPLARAILINMLLQLFVNQVVTS